MWNAVNMKMIVQHEISAQCVYVFLCAALHNARTDKKTSRRINLRDKNEMFFFVRLKVHITVSSMFV